MSKDCKKIIDKVGEEMLKILTKEDRKKLNQRSSEFYYQMYKKSGSIDHLTLHQKLLTKAIAL